MAEPTNTPLPTAPGTPISLTPRSASPAPYPYSHLPPIPSFISASASGHSSRNPSLDLGAQRSRPVVLHIGDPVRFNPDTYADFSARFDVVRPPAEDRSRDAFMAALRDRRWGDFVAIFRPFWSSGGEMGQWDSELISLLPDSVKVFASAGAGFDWADTKLLGERGIIYCNGGLAAADAVADFAMAMIISTFRMIPFCTTSALSPASFQDCHVSSTTESHNLRGHTVGIIGLGNIGQKIALKCSLAFGMNVLYYDIEKKSPHVESQLSAHYCPSMEDLVGRSDCVVLATPSGPKKLIDKESLGWFRVGSRFVNVARGSLVDEEAVADALDEGRLSNIALDVFIDEPNVPTRLSKYAGSRAMLTCHNAGGTVETHIGFEELAMRNIMHVMGGGQGITPVNLPFLSTK